jgi:hypothetical protein
MRVSITMVTIAFHALIVLVLVTAPIWAGDELVPSCTNVIPLIN